MCVIMAKKCENKITKKKTWFLYKIRDRNYDPIYKLDILNNNDKESLYLTDQINSWSEGISSSGLMIVSAALDNHSDLESINKKSKSKSKSKNKKVIALGVQKTEPLRKAIHSGNIIDATKILKDNNFVGSTFISDGLRLIILEIYVNDDSYQREIEKLTDEGIDLEKMPRKDQIAKIMEGINDSDYDISSKEIIKDDLVVRTNHGKLLPDAGYQGNDEDTSGWNSSQKRYSYAYKAIKKLENPHPFEILTALKSLKGIDDNPQNNPIRAKKGATKEKPYYSTTIILLTPSGTMYVLPLEDDIDKKSEFALKKDRKVGFVLLPKNLPLFESFSGLILRQNVLMS